MGRPSLPEIVTKKKRKPKDLMCPHTIPDRIKRRNAFDVFAQWLAVKTLGHRFEQDQRLKIGLTSDDDENLLKYRTQTELAEYLKISLDRLSRWKKEFSKELAERELWYCQSWLGSRTSTVFHSWIAGIASKKSADLIKLFLQYQLNWKPPEQNQFGGGNVQVNLIFEEVDQRGTEKADKIVN